MSFLVDTDICSAHLKNNRTVSNRFLQYTGQLYVSVITVGELLTWALRAKAPPQRLQGILDLLNDVQVLDVTDAIARKWGELRAGLFDAGRPAPDLDLFLAATAQAHALTLVTHNVQDYAFVPGLAIVDWLIP